MTTLGLAIIARDEEESLPSLLDSTRGAFDFIALLDTGSQDSTVEIFETWCSEHGQDHAVGHFKWCDDFGKARDAAHALIPPTIEWHSWADCDDVIVGAKSLRIIAEQASPMVSGYMFDYDYFHDAAGNVVSRLMRERLIRREYVKWEGRVHEYIVLPPGTVGRTGREVAYWDHAKHAGKLSDSNPRNLKILRKWNEDEPDNPRVVGYLGTECLTKGRFNEGAKWIRRYLKLTEGQRHEERAQFMRKLAIVLLMKQRNDEAAKVAYQAIAECPTWTDSYLTLAEAAVQSGDGKRGLFYAEQVLMMGAPKDTLLILNPTDYTGQARIAHAAALEILGRWMEAIDSCEHGLAVLPENEHLVGIRKRAAQQLKIVQTVETWTEMVGILVRHDEQLKALDLLDTAPHYVSRHPAIVTARSDLRRRMGWAFNDHAYDEHYETGGSKPEDMVPDDFVDDVVGKLTRGQAALEEIMEMVA